MERKNPAVSEVLPIWFCVVEFRSSLPMLLLLPQQQAAIAAAASAAVATVNAKSRIEVVERTTKKSNTIRKKRKREKRKTWNRTKQTANCGFAFDGYHHENPTNSFPKVYKSTYVFTDIGSRTEGNKLRDCWQDYIGIRLIYWPNRTFKQQKYRLVCLSNNLTLKKPSFLFLVDFCGWYNCVIFGRWAWAHGRNSQREGDQSNSKCSMHKKAVSLWNQEMLVLFCSADRGQKMQGLRQYVLVRTYGQDTIYCPATSWSTCGGQGVKKSAR